MAEYIQETGHSISFNNAEVIEKKGAIPVIRGRVYYAKPS